MFPIIARNQQRAFRAFALKKRMGLRNTPTLDPRYVDTALPQQRMKLVPMTEDEQREIRQRTGSSVFHAQKYVRA
jgi:hypothetical protein